MSKSDGQAKIDKLMGICSPEFKEKWYEIMWGKDGKSGVIQQPFPVNLMDLLPEGIKLLKDKNEHT